MTKTEIFANILHIVCIETEISMEKLLSDSKETEVVDSRYLLVYFLASQGLYSSFIANQINKSERAVNYILSNFENRLEQTKILRINYENIQKQIRNNQFCINR